MSVGQMIDYFALHGGPVDPARVTREHVEIFLADFAETHKPASVQTRRKLLRLFQCRTTESGTRGALFGASDLHGHVGNVIRLPVEWGEMVLLARQHPWNQRCATACESSNRRRLCRKMCAAEHVRGSATSLSPTGLSGLPEAISAALRVRHGHFP